LVIVFACVTKPSYATVKVTLLASRTWRWLVYLETLCPRTYI